MLGWLVCLFLGHIWSKSFLSYKGSWHLAKRCLRCRKSIVTED